MSTSRLNRRQTLARMGGFAAMLPAAALAAPLDAETLGLAGDTGSDQTAPFNQAMEQAVTEGRPLLLPAGTIRASGLRFPNGLVMHGVRGQTVLAGLDSGPVGGSNGGQSITISDVDFAGGTGESLVAFNGCRAVSLYRCGFRDGFGTGLAASQAQIVVDDCDFTGLGDAAIHSMDGLGLTITRCRIADCGNAGIRVWRGSNGTDPTIITGNRIERIDWRGGGNGQNGNGVNVFRADGVIVADNHIADCAFTAVRLNGTRNTQVSGNICLNSGEVAIFSEFAFSGSVIANNIVDGAAGGISITNLDSGGQLAVCSGNIVRNIAERSHVNPDTTPYGIYAEAETVVTGNTVQNVPGTGYAAGYGPFLRNVAITGNVANDVAIGIGVSVVDGAGAVLVSGNIISGATRHAIVGRAWNEIVEPDLVANAGRFPNVSLGENRVVPAA